MNKLLKKNSVARMKMLTDAYLELLNEEINSVEDDDDNCQLSATALVKLIELTTNMTNLQSLEINQLNEKVNKLTTIHQSHFDL